MTIKSGKGNLIVVAVMLMSFGFLFIFVGIEINTWHYEILCIGAIITIRYGITLMRVLIMDEQGCTVCFLWLKKRYCWNQLKIKRIENYKKHQGYNIPYEEGIIFSKKYVHKLIGWNPISYNFLFYPFSFFFVYFTPYQNKEKYEKRPCPPVYEVIEEEFLTQMKEWGVELEDTRRKYRRRYY